MYQKTIADEIVLKGIGVHTGRPATVRLKPAPPNTGRIFVYKGVEIPATLDHVVDAPYRTAVGCNNVVIHTTEHLLSALLGVGVTNIYIIVEGGSEIPFFDGSAKIWVDALQKAGIKEQPHLYPVCELPMGRWTFGGGPIAPYIVTYKDKEGGGLTIEMQLEYPKEKYTDSYVYHHPGSYTTEIAGARTFTFLEWLPELIKRGLIKGGNLNTAIVLHEGRVATIEEIEEFMGLKIDSIPPNYGQIMPHEPARHKILDFMGDLALLPYEFIGHITLYATGHKQHHKFLHDIMNYMGGTYGTHI